MKIVRESLLNLAFENKIYENMDQAKAILKKQNVPENDPRFLELRELLGVAKESDLVNKYGPKKGKEKFKNQKGRIGYIGKFTKWIFKEHEDFDRLKEVYDVLINHPKQVPNIDSFKTIEELYDFLQSSEISNNVKHTIDILPRSAKNAATPKLEKLLELNIQYLNDIKDFYAKKGVKFKTAEELYKVTYDLIQNLSGEFNLNAIKRKIKETKSNVDICYETADLLVIRPLDYQTSCALGSKSWCISTSQNYWDSYADVFSNQYFIYDFTKLISDKRSMIGVTVNPDSTSSKPSFKASHFKDDSVAPVSYIEEIFSNL